MILDEPRHIGDCRDISTYRLRVDLAKSIVQRLSIPEGTINWRVKPIEKAEFEFIGTLKEITNFAEGKRLG